MNKKNFPIIFLIAIPILLVLSYFLVQFELLAFGGILAIALIVIVSFFVLKNPFWGIILLIYALPFERIPTLDIGLVTLKINQVVAGLMIVSWFLRFLFDKKYYQLSHYPIGWFLVLFLLDGLISAATSYDTSRSVSVLIFTFFMIITSFVVVQLIDTKILLKKTIRALFIITFIVSLFAIYQFIADMLGVPEIFTGLKDIYTKIVFGFPRIHAFSMEPLFFGNFLFMGLSLAISYYIFDVKVNSIFKLIVTFIFLIALCMILGLSRGVYVGLAAMILFYLVFAAKTVFKIKTVLFTMLTILLVGFGAYTFLSYSAPDALERFIGQATIQDYSSSESVQKRLSDYEKAYEFWQEKPIIGIGPGNYGPRYLDYPSHTSVTDWETVNNQYLEILTEWGIVGFILFIIIIVIIFIRSIFIIKLTKDPFLRATLFGATAAMLAILVQYNFFSTIYIMHIWVYIGLLIAIQNISAQSYEKV